MSNLSRNTPVYISETEVDGLVIGTTLLTKVVNLPDYPPFNPLLAAVSIKEESNILTPCTISVGTNAPDYNNIVNTKVIGSGLGLRLLDLSPNVTSIPLNTPIYINVNLPAIPVLLMTGVLKFKVAVFGFDVEF